MVSIVLTDEAQLITERTLQGCTKECWCFCSWQWGRCRAMTMECHVADAWAHRAGEELVQTQKMLWIWTLNCGGLWIDERFYCVVYQAILQEKGGAAVCIALLQVYTLRSDQQHYDADGQMIVWRLQHLWQLWQALPLKVPVSDIIWAVRIQILEAMLSPPIGNGPWRPEPS